MRNNQIAEEVGDDKGLKNGNWYESHFYRLKSTGEEVGVTRTWRSDGEPARFHGYVQDGDGSNYRSILNQDRRSLVRFIRAALGLD